METSSQSKKKYYEIYKNLPPNAKDIFWSEEVFGTLDILKERYEISKSDKWLSRIVGFVVLGLVPPSKLSTTLILKTGKDAEKMEKLSDDIKRYILFSIKNFLEDTYKEEFIVWEYRAQNKEIEKMMKEKKEKDPYRENL